VARRALICPSLGSREEERPQKSDANYLHRDPALVESAIRKLEAAAVNSFARGRLDNPHQAFGNRVHVDPAQDGAGDVVYAENTQGA
jgi:hypothetical protein